jgi:hypothetical protein
LEIVEPEATPAPRTDPADIRARIEDTRERIRRELDLSFGPRSQPELAPVPAPVPVPLSALVPEPVVEIKPEVMIEAAPSGSDGPPPAAEGTFDQEAMRRRIDQTRNRLKAKAFDAMMSGEASLLSRDSGSAQPASTVPPVPLDSEVAESIEKTLTEEEF